MNTDMLVLGRIVAPHGVRGELRVKSETDRQELFFTLPHIYLNGNRYRIQHARLHKQVVCLVLEGVQTREEAQLLVGQWLEMPREELPPRPEGEYYICDLIGLSVYTQDGIYLGLLNEVLQPGANDVYVVAGDNGDVLVPALKRVVTEIDLVQRRMTVCLPEWEQGK